MILSNGTPVVLLAGMILVATPVWLMALLQGEPNEYLKALDRYGFPTVILFLVVWYFTKNLIPNMDRRLDKSDARYEQAMKDNQAKFESLTERFTNTLKEQRESSERTYRDLSGSVNRGFARLGDRLDDRPRTRRREVEDDEET